MSDSTIIKVDSAYSPKGRMGQTHLAVSKNMSMRLWTEEPSDASHESSRNYETIGYVISGQAELVSEGQTVRLSAGDSWVVPKGATHSYRILESFVAVEATHPPAEMHEENLQEGQ